MDIPTGLTFEEVQERIDKGLHNTYEQKVSRTYKEIFKTNVFNWFNLILFSLGGILLALDHALEALTATGVVFFNVLVGTIQEIRAKRRLDRIALLSRPNATVYRNSQEIAVPPEGIVMDDVVLLRVGDQALVDGVVLTSDSLEMDESLLTGESSPRRKKRGDTIYSGSYCVAGSGCFRVNAVGDETYANRLTSEAKKFDNKVTPLQQQTGKIVSLLVAIAAIYSIIIVLSAIIFRIPLIHTTQMVVVVLDIIPVALFLLIVIAYSLGALRMAGSGALMQRSNA
ncbi:MAG: cation-transporting P-type ATPase, partial [Candidatus Methanomethylophilaceae archaeon]|nr:cation-transporting P-type ATPase [Candidatus Methanomethylophilaceae archaeon]